MPPPEILQIHREGVKPGRDAAYHDVEAETARAQAALGCPHPYLAIESLTGSTPKEVWFFNGYESAEQRLRVVDDYARNTALMAALSKNSARKASLTLGPVNLFTNYRQDLSAGRPWRLGRGRFLVIAVTKHRSRMDGTVFKAADGTRITILPAQTRAEADAAAAASGHEPTVFAVRPCWSFPDQEWIADDALFWQADPPAAQD